MSEVSAGPHTEHAAFAASFSPAPGPPEPASGESSEQASPRKTSSPWFQSVVFSQFEEVNLSEYNPRVFSRPPEAAWLYSPGRRRINICMEELTPDRFSIIRPNGSLLKSLHILWLCESLAPACLWEPLAHPAVCILFKQRWSVGTTGCRVAHSCKK